MLKTGAEVEGTFDWSCRGNDSEAALVRKSGYSLQEWLVLTKHGQGSSVDAWKIQIRKFR